MRSGIALGSNIGDRLANLKAARDRIAALQGFIPPIKQSAIYETQPVHCESGAQNFYNAVVEIGFAKSPDSLLRSLQKIEEALGRDSEHAANVSRTIDLDLLYFGTAIRHESKFQLPHPRIAERSFVLRPLSDVAPDLRLPGRSASVRQLLAQAHQTEIVRCVTNEW